MKKNHDSAEDLDGAVSAEAFIATFRSDPENERLFYESLSRLAAAPSETIMHRIEAHLRTTHD